MYSILKEDILHPQHDTSYRYLLSSKKLFVELLRSFVARNWAKDITEEQVEEISHTFVLQDFKRQEADLVYRATLHGQDVIFYLLLELQSTVDYRMPYRLLLYQVEIWRYLTHNDNSLLENRKSFRLPPIIPIVLYNGKNQWRAAQQFRNVLTSEHLFGAELLNFEYILIDVANYTEEHLLKLSNTLGAVFLLEQTKQQSELIDRLKKLMHIMQQLPADNQQKLFSWMSNILAKKLPQNEENFAALLQTMKGEMTIMGLEKVLDDIEQRGIQQGIQTGIQKGLQEGQRSEREAIAKRMLDLGVDLTVIAAATGFSIMEIEQL